MSEAPLKLKEIVWEITSKCNKNCSYCGSKDILNSSSKLDVMEVVAEIQMAKPEVVILTGGEPALLSKDVLTRVIDSLDTTEIKIRILTNGTLFADGLVEIWKDKLDAIGWSLNSPEDIDRANEVMKRGRLIPVICKTTQVTNFGKHNIWDFDQLYKFSNNFKKWQVQLTMGSQMLPPDGIKSLYDKLSMVPIEHLYVGDNLMEEDSCGAGISNMGITYDGKVVGCLAERSFVVGKLSTYGDLKKDSLLKIWQEEFKDIRFKGGRKSCKDCVKYPSPALYSPRKEIQDFINPPPFIPSVTFPKEYPWNPTPNQVVLYAVGTANKDYYTTSGTKKNV